MKIGFVVPILSECDIKQRYEAIEKSCNDAGVNYEVIFAFNSKLNNLFSHVRSVFIENKKVKAFKVNKHVDQHKLIAVAMRSCEAYDATIIYTGKETINCDVIKAFLTSWKSGNKIVYLKKVYSGFKKAWIAVRNAIYNLGTKLMGVFKDVGAETDIQLFDRDVVITINQLPDKNRHLRTLDSFIGYNTDIVKMEVDSKIKDSKYYTDKTKRYKVTSALSWVFFALCIVFLTLGILSVTLNWKLRLIFNLMIWIAFIIFSMFSLIYFTKKILLVRVGDSSDMDDIVELESKMETYNFKE